MTSVSSRVIVVGGGIHGVCTAYYLAQQGVNCIIIEQSSIAAAASGKAGGFLAREWGSGPTVQLHHKSFDMHKQLAAQLGLESYRQVDTLEVNGNRKGKNVASWLNGKVSSSTMDSVTAQVTSKEFVEKMLASVTSPVESGKGSVEVLIDSAEGIHWMGGRKLENTSIDSGGKKKRTVAGVLTKSHGVVLGSSVVVCLGPWSGVMVEDWFGLPLPLDGVKSTSLVYKEVHEVVAEPYACFCEEDKNDCHLELYPRPNGELYVCGCGGSDYVRGDRLRAGGDCARAEQVQADPLRVEAARRSLEGMTHTLPRSREPETVQACMRPCTPDALPVMGRIPYTTNAFISCGHNCWGILWAPVCGLAMAELVHTGECKVVDLAPFSPNRYMLPTGENENEDEAEDEDGDNEGEDHEIEGTKGESRGRKKGAQQVGEQW